MNLETEKLAADIADIRIDPVLAEELMRAVLDELDDERIAVRVNDEQDFQMAAIRTAQDILTMTTFAQTMRDTVPFAAVEWQAIIDRPPAEA